MARNSSMMGAGARLRLLSGTVLLVACMGARASTPPAVRLATSALMPTATATIYIGSFNGEFQRDMRLWLSAGLQQSPLFRVVDSESDADFVMSGTIGSGRIVEGSRLFGYQSVIQLQARESGNVVWRYNYSDGRSSAEVVEPTMARHVRAAAREFVAELLSAKLPLKSDIIAKD